MSIKYKNKIANTYMIVIACNKAPNKHIPIPKYLKYIIKRKKKRKKN